MLKTNHDKFKSIRETIAKNSKRGKMKIEDGVF